VNLLGCFLLGVLLAVLAARRPQATWPPPLLSVGVLGGFTTYSAFAVEVVQVVEHRAVLLAAGYVVASVGGGVLAVVAGALAGRTAVRAP
jgi:CrcB protein